MSKRRTYSIEYLREFAESRGGRCLTEIYVNATTDVKWQCSEGHTWEDSTSHVVNDNRWCKDCTPPRHLNEEKCRYVFESLFNTPFRKDRKRLSGFELDGYNSELNLAFEHHGRQHFEFIPGFFHDTEEAFKKRQETDRMKEEMCKKLGIYLVIIPYNSYTSDEELLQYISLEIMKFPIEPVCKHVTFSDFYSRSSILKELRDIAESHGGKLLSNEYFNERQKLKFQCRRGHTFNSPVNHIRSSRRSWCPRCADMDRWDIRGRITIEDMQRIAESKGGKCLSDTYVDDKHPLLWECAKGHQWSARPTNIKKKTKPTWCPDCAKEAKTGKNQFSTVTLQDMQEIARTRGGKCLSTEYVNSQTKMLWECNKGHRWTAVANSIRPKKGKSGTWCKECAIEERRGKPRSTKVKNHASTNLTPVP